MKEFVYFTSGFSVAAGIDYAAHHSNMRAAVWVWIFAVVIIAVYRKPR